MAIYAKVIADSTSYLGKRLTTLILNYPRYIHAELLTHRVFSKNSGGSRAIPVQKFIDAIKGYTVMPIWTQNQKGMQGPIVTDEGLLEGFDDEWIKARDNTIESAIWLSKLGAHKQNVNRLLEPWMWHKVLLTGTEFDNFFKLRDHQEAQPEIRELAKMVKLAMEASKPRFLKPGQWHIPFGESIEFEDVYPFDGEQNHQNNIDRLKVSVACCARVSYNNFDGIKSGISENLALYEKLVGSEPLHASPAEHQGRVPFPNELKYLGSNWRYMSNCPEEQPEWQELREKYCSNLSGFIQLRKLIECGEF